jgi:cyclophilin family peptidyl-prolyl cis-trans isomerase
VNESDNGLLNQTGTLAMARTSDPNSATSQFFINVADNQFLNYTSPEPDFIGYCVFGKVTAGMDVVHKMSTVPTGNAGGFSDVPIKPIIIKHAKLK